MLKTYRNLSLVLTFQEYALATTIAGKPDRLSPEEVASYDSLRIPTLHSILTFFVADYLDGTIQTDTTSRRTSVTPIQSLCRVVIPIIALQDQFLPYRRSAFTGTLMNALYDTLRFGIDLRACWATYAEAMIWATMFGIYTSRGLDNEREKEIWFLKELVRGVRGRRQLGRGWDWEWDVVKTILKRFYWCEGFYGDEFKVSRAPL